MCNGVCVACAMLRECEGARVTEMQMWGGGRVVVVSAGHEYVGGTCGSGIVSSAADVQGIRGVGKVCEMCMCLVRGGVGGDGALPILWEQGVCLCLGSGSVGGVGGPWVEGLEQGLEEVVVSCLCEL